MSELSDYFSHDELKCKGSGVVRLDPRFEKAFLKFREDWGHGLVPNSTCRSVQYNASIGGASESYHLFEGVNDSREGTLAVDLPVRNSKNRADMVKLALNTGWSVGIYATFIHIDRRIDIGKDQILFRGKY